MKPKDFVSKLPEKHQPLATFLFALFSFLGTHVFTQSGSHPNVRFFK